jgi:hypothetical protein
MHDSSSFVTSFGSKPDAVVKAAVEEFFGEGEAQYININYDVVEGHVVESLAYLDSCGTVRAQKPFSKLEDLAMPQL